MTSSGSAVVGDTEDIAAAMKMTTTFIRKPFKLNEAFLPTHKSKQTNMASVAIPKNVFPCANYHRSPISFTLYTSTLAATMTTIHILFAIRWADHESVFRLCTQSAVGHFANIDTGRPSQGVHLAYSLPFLTKPPPFWLNRLRTSRGEVPGDQGRVSRVEFRTSWCATELIIASRLESIL